MKKRFLSLLLIGAVMLGGCAGESGETEKLYSDTCFTCGFDTFFALQQLQLPEEEFRTVFREASERFSYCNSLFDIYHTYQGVNSLKAVNEAAGNAPVEVSAETIDMLKRAKEVCELTDGKFDITLGRLLGVWHTYRTEGTEANEAGEPAAVPEMQELQEAASHSGWDSIVIDEENMTVFITDPDVQLDAGGIAKGYAVELIAQELLERGITTGAVNGGGNNRILGPKPDGKPWRIGIQDPEGTGALITILQDDAVSVVTSGDYERFYTGEDGRQYHHIIDPDTLYPAEYWHSVTVITPQSDLADCLSTALFTMDYEEGNALLEKLRIMYPDTVFEAVWITDADAEIDTELQRTVRNELVLYTEGLAESIDWN